MHDKLKKEIEKHFFLCTKEKDGFYGVILGGEPEEYSSN